MIIFVDIVFLIGMLIFLIAGGKLILDNIFIILLVLAAVVIFLVLLSKWPEATLVCMVITALALIIGFSVSEKKQENNIPVTIYVATDDCLVYDKNENIITIPKGAVIARYKDESERQPEGTNVFGFVNYCYWYYQGQTNWFYVSNSHETSFSNLPLSQWRVEKIKEITYKEFQNGNWYNL